MRGGTMQEIKRKITRPGLMFLILLWVQWTGNLA